VTQTSFVLFPIVVLFVVVVITAGVAIVVWLVRASVGSHQAESRDRSPRANHLVRAELAAAGGASLENAGRHNSPVAHAPANVFTRPPARDTQFLYSTGDRPLDGYTIKRGIGRGGFGEVYYAISDGGKEVALKLVQRHLDVELRGVTQYLNLKHANLVTLYDVRQAANGDYWIVMEYVTGTSLADVIAANSNGMPPDQVLAWLRGICGGVGHLHEQGIVHRDLKPGNIFIEHDTVKIGDYGLAKYISASRRSGQTESVGTVHYMAPEVSRGRYGKEIDLYALGVILFEMLAGRVPFAGESPGEILMRHLTEQPDVNMLPEPFRSVVARLLSKEPAERHGSVQQILDHLAGSDGAVPSKIDAPQHVRLQQTASWRPFTPKQPAAARQNSRTLQCVAAIGSTVLTLGFVFVTTFFARLTAPTAEEKTLVGGGLIGLVALTGFCWIRALRDHSKRALFRAAKAGDISRVRLLLNDGADANARHGRSRTPLVAAAEAGHIAVVQHLLERGADPNARLSNGETPLSLATLAGHAAVVEVLLAAGADVNSRASDGDTPLIEAAYAGHVAILRTLLEHGADTTARSAYDGSTPLIWAAYEGQTACVEALLEHGANPNEKDTGDGSTPLIWAAYGNHSNVVRVLLDHGADPSETNSSGETALDHAESDTIIQMLEAAVARR
jgi:ankyrin repeat protein